MEKTLEGFMCGFVIAAIITFTATTLAWQAWRPRVTTWESVNSRHTTWTVDIPKYIEWRGVEYKCVLIEEAKDD